MVPQTSRPATETGYFVPLLLCLGALLALRIAAIHFAKIDLVLDEAQYWTWSRDLAFGYFDRILVLDRGRVMADAPAAELIGDPLGLSGPSHALLLVLFLIGRQLFVARSAWSAIVFDTLPGLSLLFAVDHHRRAASPDRTALLVWVLLGEAAEQRLAVFFGAVVGLGLLTKRAMVYIVICVACHAISRARHEALKGGRAVVALLIALALFAPNVIWNAEHGFPPYGTQGPISAGFILTYIRALCSNISSRSLACSGRSYSSFCCAPLGARSGIRRIRERRFCSPSRCRCSPS
jgi:hypothetical protein